MTGALPAEPPVRLRQCQEPVGSDPKLLPTLSVYVVLAFGRDILLLLWRIFCEQRGGLPGFACADFDEAHIRQPPLALGSGGIAVVLTDMTKYDLGSSLAVSIPGLTVAVESGVRVRSGLRIFALAEVNLGEKGQGSSLAQAVLSSPGDIERFGRQYLGAVVVAEVVIRSG
jgi:hypothetical protein